MQRRDKVAALKWVRYIEYDAILGHLEFWGCLRILNRNGTDNYTEKNSFCAEKYFVIA